VEIHGWGDGLKLGQVSAVDVNEDDDPVILHRGGVVWDAKSFNLRNVLNAKVAVAADPVVTLDRDRARVTSSFGAGQLYMPHGLKVDGQGNIWVTDVGLHQVLRYNKGETKPSLVLGEKFVPGNDATHFCKPTSVAVTSGGQVFVADGYCNNRVAVFTAAGQHLHDIRGEWTVVHSIVLYEAEDVLCVADREGRRADCVGAGIRSPQFRGSRTAQLPGLGRVFGLAGRGTALLAVTGAGSFLDPPPRGVTVDLANDNTVVNTWGEDLVNPHAVAVSRAGDAVYVAEIGPNKIRKFEVVTPTEEMF